VKPDESKSAFALTRAGKEEALTFRTDYILGADPSRRRFRRGPRGFCGLRRHRARQSYDDYKQIDAKGKIVAFLFGAPKFESSLKAHYSSGEIKQANAVATAQLGSFLWTTRVSSRFILSANG